eukprot:NODE_70_length_24940_cov_0.663138.p9 type:complete len:371 gc:universal NODE_70_length_24940_cov_0.663138:3614-2502(-)
MILSMLIATVFGMFPSRNDGSVSALTSWIHDPLNEMKVSQIADKIEKRWQKWDTIEKEESIVSYHVIKRLYNRRYYRRFTAHRKNLLLKYLNRAESKLYTNAYEFATAGIYLLAVTRYVKYSEEELTLLQLNGAELSSKLHFIFNLSSDDLQRDRQIAGFNVFLEKYYNGEIVLPQLLMDFVDLQLRNTNLILGFTMVHFPRDKLYIFAAAFQNFSTEELIIMSYGVDDVPLQLSQLQDHFLDVVTIMVSWNFDDWKNVYPSFDLQMVRTLITNGDTRSLHWLLDPKSPLLSEFIDNILNSMNINAIIAKLKEIDGDNLLFVRCVILFIVKGNQFINIRRELSQIIIENQDTSIESLSGKLMEAINSYSQ